MTKEQKFAEDLIDFTYASPSPYQAVRNIKAALLRKGYKQLFRGDSWRLEKGEKYFVTKNSSSIVSFITGTGDVAENGFRIICAHTDAPGLKLKPQPEMIAQNSYLKLNVEVYGGVILSTWLDRPLSMAGRITLRSDNPLKPDVKYMNIRKPLLIIPSLAIHLNRDINENKQYKRQIDMLPLMQLADDKFEKKDYIKQVIAEHINAEAEEILDFDIFLYEYEKGCLTGAKNEFISSPKMDDLAMVHAGVEALLSVDGAIATQVMVCFDNEEVGSQTKQGAGSPFLKDILERVTWAFNDETDAFVRAKANSFGISADMAHAVHPNHPEKHDPVLRPVLNGGPVIKYSAAQKYTTDSVSAGMFTMLCNKVGIPFQQLANHSDMHGGSTLGNVLTRSLDINMTDMGNPMLAMHSVRELGGVIDHYYIKTVFEEFYKV